MAENKDWVAWHSDYDDPNSSLSRRLRDVQQELRHALDRRPGPVRIISMCAGQGRDVIPVLASHRARDRATALLVELDEHNTNDAQESVRLAGLTGVRVRRADASLTDNYADAVPADILLACGIFGNVSDDDVRHTISYLPSLSARGATVLWTRAREPHRDFAQDIRNLFEAAGFVEEAFYAPGDVKYRVGVHRLIASPQPFQRGIKMFQFH
jgi:hypothetical protein